jgi:CheY-like chemotaxis protein
VDDNDDIRFLLDAVLSTTYDVTEYESGSDALAGIARQRPDVVLLDISLPDLDGTEILRRLRSDLGLADLPVIALTANALAGDRERFLAAGFNGYVTKPVLDETILLRAITALLG